MARAFALMGHEVSVITSDAVPAYVRGLNPDFGKNPDGVDVIRLRPKLNLGQIVISSGINAHLIRINPDLVVVIGLGKAFPKPVFDTGYQVVTLFGDNAYSYANGTLKSKLLFSLFKKSTYRAAIRKSKALVAYTPESFEAAAKMVGGKEAAILRKQTRFISLGFWPDAFFYSPDLRTTKRRELGFGDNDCVIITATRLVPEKNLEGAISFFKKLPKLVKWLLVGSSGGAYAKRLRAALTEELSSERFRILGYADKTNLNALYNASDIALYTVPAISVFEAAGTGLPLILPNEKSLSHIQEAGFCVADYRGEETDLTEWMWSTDGSLRKARSIKALDIFGWQAISEKILNG